MAVLLLLAFDKLAHSAGVASFLEVQGKHKAVDEQHKANAKDDYEVALPYGEEGGGGASNISIID